MEQTNNNIRKVKLGIMRDPKLRKMLVRSGRNEILLDLDGDGSADICISSEGKGNQIDTFAIDLSGNGEFNFFLHDVDGNGIPDSVLWADDGTGEIEVVAAGSEVEQGLIAIVTKISNLLAAEELLNEEFGVSLADLAEYLKIHAAIMLAEIEKRFNAEGIEKVYYFLDDAKTYYLATVDGSKARVRPFGTVLLYDGKLYISTGKSKDVSKQIAENPNVELCAFIDGTWLRVSGELADDDNHDVKVAMLDKMPELKDLYSADDDNMQMFYFKDATATFSSFTDEPEVIKF